MADDTKGTKISNFNASANTNGGAIIGGATPQAPPPPQLSKGELVKQQASQTAAKKQADKEAADKAAEQAAEQARQQDLLTQVGAKIGEGQDAIAGAAAPAVNWLANQPTPGGVLTVFLILVFFLLAVTPVNKNGDSRLKLLWLTITGKTHLDYSGNTEQAILTPKGSPTTTATTTTLSLEGIDLSALGF
jgi:hypothetical protein